VGGGGSVEVAVTEVAVVWGVRVGVDVVPTVAVDVLVGMAVGVPVIADGVAVLVCVAGGVGEGVAPAQGSE
jgi:hypothetical protein